MRALLIALLLSSSWFVASAESDTIPWGDIRNACSRYLDAKSTKEDVAAMAKKLRESVVQKMADNSNVDEDQAARDIMLDWAAGNRKRIEKGEHKALAQMCFYFMTFIDKGYLIPKYIREEMTPEKAKKLIEFLDNAGKVSGETKSARQ